MMRLLGVLVGSALAAAALVVFVGIPEFTTESSVAENTVITLPMRPEPAAPGTGPVAPEQPAQASAPADPPAAPGIAAAKPEATSATIETPPTPSAPEARWHAFWSPFRSEIAAQGFVEQLQRVTGLDYRVVRLEPGVYEVAVAYEDEPDIGTKLSQISAATGLRLPED